MQVGFASTNASNWSHIRSIKSVQGSVLLSSPGISRLPTAPRSRTRPANPSPGLYLIQVFFGPFGRCCEAERLSYGFPADGNSTHGPSNCSVLANRLRTDFQN